MQVIAEHRETGQTVQGLLTTAKRTLPTTWASFSLDPQELVVKEKHNSYSCTYELSKLFHVLEIE